MPITTATSTHFTPLPPPLMTGATRRRSSAFRPHNGLYPPVFRPRRLSLEQLPVPVLALILEQLQTADLLAVCVTSKDLYLPAATQLHRKLVVTDDTLALAYARDHLRLYGRNYGTAVRPGHLLWLAAHLSTHRKLAVLVRAVYVGPGADPAAVARLLQCTAPSDVYLGLAGAGANILDVALAGARRLTCAADQLPQLRARHLTHLRLCAAATDPVAVARVLAAAPLRTLVFRAAHGRDLRLLNLQNTGGARPPPVWMAIFREIAAAGSRLDLTALELDGHVTNVADAVGVISSAVALERLGALLLCVTERTHPGLHLEIRAAAAPPTLLCLLARSTPSLRHLSIAPTDDCLACQELSVVAALALFAGQLEQLTVFFEAAGSGSSAAVRSAVLATQPRLRRLDCRDRASLGEARAHLYLALDQAHISQWEHGLFYEHRIRTTFFANDFGTRSARFMPDPLARCISACAPAIARFLERDPVYTARPPQLQYYSVVDFCVAVQRRALIVNGRDVALAPVQ